MADCISNPVEVPLAVANSDSARFISKTCSLLNRPVYNSEESSTGYFWMFSFKSSVVKYHTQVKSSLGLQCVALSKLSFLLLVATTVAIHLNFHFHLISAFVKTSCIVGTGRHLMVTSCQLCHNWRMELAFYLAYQAAYGRMLLHSKFYEAWNLLFSHYGNTFFVLF